jgi:hypothetical protein
MTKKKDLVGDVYYPAPEVIARAHVPDYDAMNDAAVADLAGFWGGKSTLCIRR